MGCTNCTCDKLHIGSVVQLTCGGPKMTVNQHDNTRVLCAYFNNDGVLQFTHNLSKEMLVTVK